jgi:hypothetical protein
LARCSVSGCNRSPRPPASTIVKRFCIAPIVAGTLSK